MIDLLVALSSVLTVASAAPYIIEIVQGKAKPRVVSWFTWSLLTGIACAASLTDKQYPSAILMAFATVETMLIVILGVKHGNRRFEKFDIGCQVAALGGLALWFIVHSPAVAVAATVAIDLIGALPTLKHAWQKPHEETALTFALAGVGGGCTVLAATSWKITAVAYPIYIAIINIVLTSIIVGRKRHTVAVEVSELRHL